MDTGGPAFPFIAKQFVPSTTEPGKIAVMDECEVVYPGATMLDYFAAKAMQGILSRGVPDEGAATVAGFSYDYAAALLAERARLMEKP